MRSKELLASAGAVKVGRQLGPTTSPAGRNPSGSGQASTGGSTKSVEVGAEALWIEGWGPSEQGDGGSSDNQAMVHQVVDGRCVASVGVLLTRLRAP